MLRPAPAPGCGGALGRFGEGVTEILEAVQGSFRVIRHVRPKLSCRACKTYARRRLPACRSAAVAPERVCWRTCWWESISDHLPLHRQAEIYAREDIDLSRSTLADMVGQVAGLVRPLIDALARYVMAGERVHADDTEIPVLEPGLGEHPQSAVVDLRA